MCSRMDIHRIVPEYPEYWIKLVKAYNHMSREDQLRFWRKKRKVWLQGDPQNEYATWIRYLSKATGETDAVKLVPPEILAEEEAARKTNKGN